MWADDNWLQEHAGATLTEKQGEEQDSEETSGEKRPNEDVQVVVMSHFCLTIHFCHNI